MQQDAHEFLNFLINHINEIILGKLNKKIYIYDSFILFNVIIRIVLYLCYIGYKFFFIIFFSLQFINKCYKIKLLDY